MKRFVFKLQRILEIRIQACDDAQTHVDNCQRIVAELRRLLLEQRDSYISERDELNVAVCAGETFKFAVYEQSLESRKARMMELLQAIRIAEQELDLALQELTVCRRNLKIMENFRDKKLEEFVRAEEAKERKFLDEQATLRYQRDTFQDSRER
jgi:flagellar export protein FliJ